MKLRVTEREFRDMESNLAAGGAITTGTDWHKRPVTFIGKSGRRYLLRVHGFAGYRWRIEIRPHRPLAN